MPFKAKHVSAHIYNIFLMQITVHLESSMSPLNSSSLLKEKTPREQKNQTKSPFLPSVFHQPIKSKMEVNKPNSLDWNMSHAADRQSLSLNATNRKQCWQRPGWVTPSKPGARGSTNSATTAAEPAWHVLTNRQLGLLYQKMKPCQGPSS